MFPIYNFPWKSTYVSRFPCFSMFFHLFHRNISVKHLIPFYLPRFFCTLLLLFPWFLKNLQSRHRLIHSHGQWPMFFYLFHHKISWKTSDFLLFSRVFPLISSENLRKNQHQENYVDLLLERQLITLDDAATFKEVDGSRDWNKHAEFMVWLHGFLSQKSMAFRGFYADFLWDFIACFGSFWDIMRFSQPIWWFLSWLHGDGMGWEPVKSSAQCQVCPLFEPCFAAYDEPLEHYQQLKRVALVTGKWWTW